MNYPNVDYENGVVRAEIHLPKKQPYCINCIIGCGVHTSYENRYYCRFTGEILLEPKKQRGAACPVEWSVSNEQS